MTKTLAMIHTVSSLVAPFGALARELLPGVSLFHVADEGLLGRVLREGEVTPSMCLRVVELASHAQDDGADAILLTCSAMSPAVDLAAPLLRAPIYKVDQAMVDRALELGRRIAVFSTARATLTSVSDLVRSTAAARGRQVEIVTGLCEEAMTALRSGRREDHDRMVRAALANLVRGCDVLLMAQASAAQALRQEDQEALGVPVLTSPRLALEWLRDNAVWAHDKEA
jgi:Asp/Glu/hydantoin racemase